MSKENKHPAKYSDQLLPVFKEMLKGCNYILDPFAGTGKIHNIACVGVRTVGIEIEIEWSNMHRNTLHGDSTDMCFNDNTFSGICTSPTYGNRMADCHNAKDGSKRNTYTHVLGRKLADNNSGKMQWGSKYRELHEKVYRECRRVLFSNGIFVLNMKNHIRKGKEVDVFGWHVSTLIELGFVLREVIKVPVTGNGFGKNSDKKLDFEYVAKFELHKEVKSIGIGV